MFLFLQVATWLMLDGLKTAFKDIILKAFNFNLEADLFVDNCNKQDEKEDSDNSAIILSLLMGIVSVTFAQYQRYT